MTSRPLRWRGQWALAHATGVLFSSAVWIVLVATSPAAGALLLAGAVAFVATFRTRPVLWLVFGARPADQADQDAVLRAIVPVVSLRGRGQPEVWVVSASRRSRAVMVLGRSALLVHESLLAAIKAGQIADVEVSSAVARAYGQLPALWSRATLLVDLYCLPWTVVADLASRAARRLSSVPLVSLSWRMRSLVFCLGLVDAIAHARWEAAVPLLVLAVLTYTTGPFERAWQHRLAELGYRRAAAEGLGSMVPLASHTTYGVRTAVDQEARHE
jgi:hypothetical protein